MRLLSFRLRKCATGSKNPRLSNARRFEGSSNSVTWIVTEYRSLFATFQTRPPLILEFSSSGEKKKEEKRKKMLPPFLHLTSHTASTRAGVFFRTRVTKISDYLATTLPYQRINRPAYTSFRIKQTLEPNDYLVTQLIPSVRRNIPRFHLFFFFFSTRGNFLYPYHAPPQIYHREIKSRYPIFSNDIVKINFFQFLHYTLRMNFFFFDTYKLYTSRSRLITVKLNVRKITNILFLNLRAL